MAHTINPSTQEADLCEFKTSLVYQGLQRETLSQKEKNQTNKPNFKRQKEKRKKEETKTEDRREILIFGGKILSLRRSWAIYNYGP